MGFSDAEDFPISGKLHEIWVNFSYFNISPIWKHLQNATKIWRFRWLSCFFFFSLTWKVDEICPSLSPFLRLIKWMASKSRQDSWNHTSAFWMFLGHFWFKGKPSLIFCMETSSPNIISWALLYSRALQDSKISMQTSDPMWCCNLRRLKRYRNLQTRKHEQRKKTWKHRLTSQSTVSHTNVKCN